MKRYMWIATIMALAFGSLLASWGTTSSAASEALKVAWILGGPISDVGWNAAHHRGITAVEKAFPGKVEVTYKESVPAGPQTAQVIDSLVQAGNKIIFTSTIGFARYTEAAAQKYPQVKFIQFEGATIRENLAAFNANFPDGFYILGMAAGAVSKSGAIGMVGAFSSPSNVRALNELLLGARRINPNATVQVVFINSWFDPPKETQAAQSLLASRADVLGMMMNSPSTGRVAENAQIPFLGRDSDQRPYAPNSYLAGAILNWAPYYVSEVKAALDGTWKARDEMLQIKEGAVEVIFGKAYEKLNDAQRAEIAMVQRQMASGEFYAFTGPLYDQKDTLRVAAGERLSSKDALHMDWFVQGVVTSQTGR
jgi:basic membrane protein A and related proteins